MSTLKVDTIKALTASDVEVDDALNVTGTLSVGDVDLAGSSGSSLVGFAQSGSAPGTRTVQTKVREVEFSLMDKSGAVADGVTDLTTQWANFIADANTEASAAVGTGDPITTYKAVIPSGDYVITTGATMATCNLIIEGRGKGNTRIRIGSGQYLLTVTGTMYQFELRGVATSGGKGVLKHSATGANVQGIPVIEDNYFNDYTECAIGSLSSDFPYWKIKRNLFRGDSGLTSKGIALAGARDMSEIDGNAFHTNLYHIKLGTGGNNVKLRNNDFIRFVDGNGSPVLVDIWIVPHTSAPNSGDGFEATGNKFGNENLDVGDVRVLVADESTGTDFVDKNHATTVSTGFWVGPRIKENYIGAVSNMTRGFVYSYTPNIRYAEIVNRHIVKQPYILEYNSSVTFSVDDRTQDTNILGGIFGNAFESLTGPISTQESVGLPVDPMGVLQGHDGYLKTWQSGFDAGFKNILVDVALSAAGNVNSSEVATTDAVGGSNAITVTYTASTGRAWINPTMANVDVGRLAWVEVDVKQASSEPLTYLKISLRTDVAAFACIRFVKIPEHWTTIRFPWIPRQSGTTLRLDFVPADYSAGVKTQVDIGRPRIYHAHEPVHAGYFQQGVTDSVLPVVTKASVVTTNVGNVGTGEDDLMTYAMPANAMHVAGKGVKITAWGATANNSNTKELKLYFGSVAILTTALTISQAGVWRATATVVSTGTDAQDYSSQLIQGGTTTLMDAEAGTLTQNDGAAITIKCTGAVADGGGGVNNDDIVQQGMLVEFLS